MTQLYERYRPKSWGEVIAQSKVVDKVQGLAARDGLGGRAYWLSGSSGTGKTSVGYLLAHEIAEDFNVQEVDAGQLTPADVRKLDGDSHLYGMGAKSGRAYIVNEAHGLRRDTVRQLLVTLERIPGHVVWIFTATVEGQEMLFENSEDACPLLSRCIRLPLSRQGLAQPFAARCREIAQAEGLDGQPIAAYVRLAQACKNNFRAMLTEVESGAMMPR
ncbi:MAG: hypothetical protein IMZ57_02250 [Acidobacteria bacterium]|nr:hypothetical protein [Acidobacteriota bacterium]